MSFILADADGDDLQINIWNWRVILSVLEAGEILTPQTRERLGYNIGAILSFAEVKVMADFLERIVLPMIGPGQRLKLSGEITSEPPETEMRYDKPEENYSLQREILVDLIRFLRRCRAPITVG